MSIKLKGGMGVEPSIRNGKVFNPAWTKLTGPTPEYTKAILQAEYETCNKRVENLRINLSNSYRLVLGKCTD